MLHFIYGTISVYSIIITFFMKYISTEKYFRMKNEEKVIAFFNVITFPFCS